MTSVIILNLVLALAVLTTVLAVIAWAVRHSHHEGQAVTVASRRQWRRHTISLRPHIRPSRSARPFVLDADF